MKDFLDNESKEERFYRLAQFLEFSLESTGQLDRKKIDTLDTVRPPDWSKPIKQ